MTELDWYVAYLIIYIAVLVSKLVAAYNRQPRCQVVRALLVVRLCALSLLLVRTCSSPRRIALESTQQ